MMDQPLLQPVIAICFLHAGIIMGLIYDLFTAVRSILHAAAFRHVADAICTIIMFSVFAVVSLFTTGGTMRFYCFLTAGVGFWIERRTIHALLSPYIYKWFTNQSRIS